MRSYSCLRWCKGDPGAGSLAGVALESRSAAGRIQLIPHSTVLPGWGWQGQLVTLLIKTWKHKPTFSPLGGGGQEREPRSPKLCLA